MSDIVIVGGGPSGLAAAHEAVSHGAAVTVLERLDRVGGLARTIPFEGSRFDIGAHRFFTKNSEIHELFTRVLGDDLIRVPRLSRILHDGTYFDYPLTPINAMFGIGLREGFAIAGSYAAARLRAALAPRPLESFEDWIVDRFGRCLYGHFFKTYTEKVWGIPCKEISADWAAQRIRGLSLGAAVRNALWKPKTEVIKTLVDEFVYPRLGAGQAYEKMAAFVNGHGGTVLTNASVRRIRREGMRACAVVVERKGEGPLTIEGRYFLVSAPLTELIEMFEPAAPPEVQQAARALRYRDHIGVNLVVRGNTFPDSWIYVHSKSVAMARIANYRNFSVEMAGQPDVSPLTVEYFVFGGDEISRCSDEMLIRRATDELHATGIIKRDQVVAGFVVRSPKAYPVIEIGHRQHVETIKAWLDQFENLLPIGRSGMFKYNNQDHAMATGLLAARTALGLRRFDPWLVNIDAEYHEAGSALMDEPEPAKVEGREAS
jgi:protoporphyrinogen oxidase